MTVQLSMTVVEQTEDERPEPKVSVFLVEYPTIDNFLDWLSDMRAGGAVVHQMTDEE